MSHIATWLLIVCAAVIAHFLGIRHEAATIIMGISGACLALHWILAALYRLGTIEDDVPHPDLHDRFLKAYHFALEVREPEAWAAAATAAKRWENALTKPAKHTVLAAFRRSQHGHF